MKIVNIGEIPNKQYDVLGLVKGSVVRGIVKDIFTRWQNFIGVEMKKYKETLDVMRDTATKRMTDDAEILYANAVLNVTYSSVHILPGIVEIVVYGTAVKFIDK